MSSLNDMRQLLALYRAICITKKSGIIIIFNIHTQCMHTLIYNGPTDFHMKIKIFNQMGVIYLSLIV